VEMMLGAKKCVPCSEGIEDAVGSMVVVGDWAAVVGATVNGGWGCCQWDDCYWGLGCGCQDNGLWRLGCQDLAGFMVLVE
jgi:hypothetical protein